VAGRISIAASALLLAGSLLWGRCVSCRTLAAQEPAHDCCQKDSCHRDSSPQPVGKQCPHQAQALEQYAKADPVTPVAAVTAVVIDAGSDLAPLPAVRVSPAAPLLVHSPPDLYLRNSALLI
jgi:hypothetical protein